MLLNPEKDAHAVLGNHLWDPRAVRHMWATTGHYIWELMMKSYLGLALASAFVLGACDTTSGSQTGTVVDSLIGTPLVGSDGSVFLFNPDGSVGGNLRGEPIVGKYDANTREVCSTYSAPKNLVGREYCSVPKISGDTLIFNRRDGSQSQPYKIGG